MAPITKTIVLAACAAMVSARPLVVRDPSPSMVTETVWTTVDVPVTLWVDDKGNALSTVAQGGNFAAVPTTPSTSSAVTTTTTPVAVAPVQPASPSTTLMTTTSSAAQEQPAPVASSSTTPVPVAPAPSSSAPIASPPAPAAASPAPAAPGSGGSTGNTGVRGVASSTNSCEGSGAACSGDITHYDGGLGACGWNVNTASDMAIALPYEFMGTQSNGNPYCGRSVTIQNPTTGQTAQATVGDKCMGCTGRSIDLTDALFNTIGGGCDGRCSGFDWWFN